MSVYVKKPATVLPTTIEFSFGDSSAGTMTGMTITSGGVLIDNMVENDINGYQFDCTGSGSFEIGFKLVKSGATVTVYITDGNGTVVSGVDFSQDLVTSSVMSAYSDGTYEYTGTITPADAASWGSFMELYITVTLSTGNIVSTGTINDGANEIVFSEESWTDPSS